MSYFKSPPFEVKKDLRKDPAEARLDRILHEMGKVLVAFSGGVDSTYLLWSALNTLGPHSLRAVTVRTPLTPEEEITQAVAVADGIGFPVRVVDMDPLVLEEVSVNSPLRCYACKRLIFERLAGMAEAEGIPSLVDGTNAEDLNTHRPGLRALRELRVRSPLAEAGLDKVAIRRLSREAGLPTWDRPSAPCLATRFPYGTALTEEGLRRVEAGERILRREGFNVVRLRCHGEVARIEIPAERLGELFEEDRRRRVLSELTLLGFSHVSLDLAGHRSGSMDRAPLTDPLHRPAAPSGRGHGQGQEHPAQRDGKELWPRVEETDIQAGSTGAMRGKPV